MSIYPHVATIWHKLPEVERKARWLKEELPRTHWESRDGSRTRASGDVDERRALLLVPGCQIDFSVKKGDCMAYGHHDELEPPENAYEIRTFETVMLGDEISHFEVVSGNANGA